MSWDWQESVAKWSREKINADIRDKEGLIYDMSSEDVLRILKKTDYKFVEHLDFAQLHKMAVNKTIQQINKKSDFIDSIHNNKRLIRKLVSRVANNLSNLFDKRYKDSLVAYRDLDENFDNSGASDFEDPLSILLLEEEITLYEEEVMRMDKEYMEDLRKIFRIDGDNQAFLDF